MMPWYCGYCSRWNKKEYHCCPDCGRPPKGRVCRACKNPVPRHAAHCTTCGSRRLSEVGTATLPFTIPVRIGLLIGFLILLWIVIQLVTPLVLALGRWTVHLAMQGLFLALLFWLLTGLLPTGVGAKVRSGTWHLVCRFVKFLINLFK